MPKLFSGKSYVFPFAPLSLNQAYSQRRAKGGFMIRFLRNEYKAYKAEIKNRLEQQGPLTFEPPFCLNFHFIFERSSFFFKNGKIRKHDVSDYFKLAEDACAEHWGIDDCNNLLVFGSKFWVPDGELKDFEENAYHKPPHKLRGIIRLTVKPLDLEEAKWNGIEYQT